MDDATAAAYRAMGYIRRQTKGRPLYSEAEAAGVCRDCWHWHGCPSGCGYGWCEATRAHTSEGASCEEFEP